MTTSDYAVAGWLMAANEPDPFAWVASLTRRPLWHADAACRGSGTSAFFPTRGVTAATMTRARDTCSRCPVTDECLSYAMSDIDAVGIWGGTTGTERRAMRRDVTMAPTGAEAIVD
jgi:WhiB family redox-sensing transcriptional regulator